MLAIAGIAATKPPAHVAGQPTLDAAELALRTFPYPHLSVTAADDRAKIVLDDGSVDPQVRLAFTVPRDGRMVRDDSPVCDPVDLICWGATTVDPVLTTRIELVYLGVPCSLTGSPGIRTQLVCDHG